MYLPLISDSSSIQEFRHQGLVQVVQVDIGFWQTRCPATSRWTWRKPRNETCRNNCRWKGRNLVGLPCSPAFLGNHPKHATVLQVAFCDQQNGPATPPPNLKRWNATAPCHIHFQVPHIEVPRGLSQSISYHWTLMELMGEVLGKNGTHTSSTKKTLPTRHKAQLTKFLLSELQSIWHNHDKTSQEMLLSSPKSESPTCQKIQVVMHDCCTVPYL